MVRGLEAPRGEIEYVHVMVGADIVALQKLDEAHRFMNKGEGGLGGRRASIQLAKKAEEEEEKEAQRWWKEELGNCM